MISRSDRTDPLFRASFDRAPVGLAHVAPDGSWIRINPRLCEIVGHDETALLGLNFEDIAHPDEREPDRERVAALVAGLCDQQQWDMRLLHADGSVVQAWLTRSLLCDEAGQQIAFIVAVDDSGGEVEQDRLEARVAERTRALSESVRRLERANAEVERFAYVASHDLQEPLRMVASYTELIGSRYGDQLDEQGQQFVHFAVDGARRMQQLIRDLLEYSRVGRIADPPQRIELSALVREVWREIVVAQDLDVAVEALSLEGAAEVVADRKALAQALRALLVNAVRFAGASPCRVDVSCTTVGDQVRLDVRDSGIGVAPRDRERIFDLFVRLHGRSEYPGTGLGLAICRKVIEHHGGCVACVGNDSERGATFRVTLPAAGGGVT